MKTLIAISALSLFALSGGAFAEDKKPDPNLPGVDSTYSIVKPEPDEPEAVKADEDGFVMIGDTRVKISGTIRYDVDYVGKNKKSPFKRLKPD